MSRCRGLLPNWSTLLRLAPPFIKASTSPKWILTIATCKGLAKIPPAPLLQSDPPSIKAIADS